MTKRITTLFFVLLCGVAFAQTPSAPPQPGTPNAAPRDTTVGTAPVRKIHPLFDTVTFMPYLTASLNFFSGGAFLANATGPGGGAGVEFDLTHTGQKVGFLFDFAFQDMYGVGRNGSYISSLVSGDTGVNPSADAYHYWQYLLFEPFLKIQSNGKRFGYFLVGASLGFAVQSETVSIAPGYPYEYQFWDQTPWGNRFRLDIRAGLGVQLGTIAGHPFMLEARAGFPITNAISGYSGSSGTWRIITVQANFGLRF